MKNKYRWLLVDYYPIDNSYTFVIQEHKELIVTYWRTIKTIETNNKQYGINCCQELCDLLNEDNYWDE